MPRKCKTCSCTDKLEWINEKIRAKTPLRWVSSNLRSLGVQISESSLQRHATNCDVSPNADRAPIQEQQQQQRSDAHDVIPHPEIVDSQTVIDEAIKSSNGDIHVLSHILRETAVSQVAMVRAKQLAYMSGEGINPIEDVKVLSMIHGILKEEAVVTNLRLDADMTIREKAVAIMQAVTDGKLSPNNGDRLLGVLGKMAELVEYDGLIQEIDAAIEATKSAS